MSVVAAVFAALTLVSMACVTGLFWAFSIAGMPGLDAIKPGEAIHAMQSINRKILNPLFYLVFVGAPAWAAVTGVLLLVDGKGGAGVLFLVAAATYFLGGLMLTGAINVPLNNTLDAAQVPEDEGEAAKIWAAYSPRWTRWNTIRGVLCGVSLLIAALGVYVWGNNA